MDNVNTHGLIAIIQTFVIVGILWALARYIATRLQLPAIVITVLDVLVALVLVIFIKQFGV